MVPLHNLLFTKLIYVCFKAYLQYKLVTIMVEHLRKLTSLLICGDIYLLTVGNAYQVVLS